MSKPIKYRLFQTFSGTWYCIPVKEYKKFENWYWVNLKPRIEEDDDWPDYAILVGGIPELDGPSNFIFENPVIDA